VRRPVGAFGWRRPVAAFIEWRRQAGADQSGVKPRHSKEFSPAKMPAMSKRCAWAKTDLSVAYHDHEWGVPVHDDAKLFEFLILEGAQAGLSWEIILRKRDAYRRAFDFFDPAKVAKYGDRKITQLLGDAGIVRNRLKINSAIQNAKSFLQIQKEFGSFDAYVWQFVDGVPKNRKRGAPVPAFTAESDAMSKGLSGRGFKFVGSTICYAFMQAVGMVNDHDHSCFRRPEIIAAQEARSS
jgi:DNA-3-methyladenine glycosylase I